MQWTKEDKQTLAQLGVFLGEATFTLKGADVIPLYRGLALLAKVGSMMDHSAAEKESPATPAEDTTNGKSTARRKS